MSRSERVQPAWDRVGDYELDYTGVVPQRELQELIIVNALADSGRWEIPLWCARAMARQLADAIGPKTSALHHFAITGEGRVGDLMDEISSALRMESRLSFIWHCANGLADFIKQELDRLDPCGPSDDEGGQS